MADPQSPTSHTSSTAPHSPHGTCPRCPTCQTTADLGWGPQRVVPSPTNEDGWQPHSRHRRDTRAQARQRQIERANRIRAQAVAAAAPVSVRTKPSMWGDVTRTTA
jgi:hypothetical protein